MADEKTAGRMTPPRSAGQMGRDQIARMVVVASFLSVFLLVGSLVALAKFEASAAASAVAEKAFNAILPVLAGWVGTVLAFYFSAASQERTSDSLDRAMQQTTSRPADGTLVASKMIPLSQIRGIRELRDRKDKPQQFELSSFQTDFNSKPEGRAITRLMFLEGGAFKYILHVGTLNKFLAAPAPRRGGAPSSPTEEPATFDALLKDPDLLKEISTLVAFVSVSNTLAEAKAALDKVPGAQDIIVTATGNPTEQLIGWLSNVDLTRALTVT